MKMCSNCKNCKLEFLDETVERTCGLTGEEVSMSDSCSSHEIKTLGKIRLASDDIEVADFAGQIWG